MKRSRSAPEDPPEFEPVALALATPHAYDDRIRFTEHDHKYFVNFDAATDDFESEGVTSTSTFVHQFFPSFNPPEVIRKMRAGKNFATSKYAGMTDGEIQRLWKRNGEQASKRGTLLHFLLECHNNGYDLASSDYGSIPEVQDYLRWRQRHFTGLVAFRTELRMFTGPDLRLTGTADLIAVREDHPPPEECGGVLSLHLIDWKFSRAIRMDNRYEHGHGVCADLPNCNHSLYALQQNLYKYMLETFYTRWTWRGHTYTSTRVVSMHLAVFHENHGREGYYLELPDMQPRVRDMLRVRRDTLSGDADLPQ